MSPGCEADRACFPPLTLLSCVACSHNIHNEDNMVMQNIAATAGENASHSTHGAYMRLPECIIEHYGQTDEHHILYLNMHVLKLAQLQQNLQECTDLHTSACVVRI